MMKNNVRKTILPPLIPLFVVAFTVEMLVRGGLVPGYLVPAPSAVLRVVAT